MTIHVDFQREQGTSILGILYEAINPTSRKTPECNKTKPVTAKGKTKKISKDNISREIKV
jgi:hypothetical protein